MDKVNITIVGAGVIGLAVARELSDTSADIFVIEKNDSFGRETSSRNSEVIHAGIYYPKGSLKHKTCIEGNPLLYEFCSKNNVPAKKIGKLIVAIDKSECRALENLLQRGIDNGVGDLRLISKEELKRLEPNIAAEAAMHSPSTGIIDSHGFMKTLVKIFESRNGRIAYGTEVTGIEHRNDGFTITTKSAGGTFKFSSNIFINCAGLDSYKISCMAGITDKEYELKYCKGDYFRVSPSKSKFINRLIYPVPKEDRAGLGIHATLDLAGGLRLGPDDEYISAEGLSYNVAPAKKTAFYEGVRTFLPFIKLDDLSPDMAGIRPKLQGAGEGFRDFLIKEESGRGLDGFINLVGIESPGLTSALSIAQMVKKLVIRRNTDG